MNRFLGLVIQNDADEFLAAAVLRWREGIIKAWSRSPEFACLFRSLDIAWDAVRQYEINGASVLELWDCGNQWETRAALSLLEFQRRRDWWNGLEERHRREMLLSPSIQARGASVDACWQVFGPDASKSSRGRGNR
jgi:hypothetical protein